MWKALKHPRARPWLTVAASMPASVGTHALWGSSPAAGVGLTLAAGLLTASAWWAGDGTSKARRLHATLSTAAGTSYMVVATVTDPLDPFLASTWAIGGAVAAGGWNIRQALRTNPDAKTGGQAAGETGLLAKAIGEAKVKMRGKPKVEPNKVTVPLQLQGGQVTSDDLGARIKYIAGELGVSPTSVKVISDPDHADRATLVVIPEDMLKKATPWPGPSNLGGSITDPVVIGVYEDGEQAVLWFPWATGRNATHFLTAGMNGSGKSAGMSVGMTEVLTRRDVIVWAIDPSKGLQTFAPFLPHLDWVEMSMAGGEAMIEALKQVITARADAMGRHGFKNWTPEVHERLAMPYMIVWVEEAAKFFRDGTEMEGLVMEARSAGISVIISLQRPSATSMPTDVREQLGGALVFGVKGGATADMALPEDVRDAGARPEVWQNRRPGYAYLVAPGVDEERYPFPMRTYLIDDEAIETALSHAPRPAADPVTVAAAGEAYARRAIYTPGQPLAGITPKETVMTVEDAEREEEIRLERQVERDIAAAVGGDDTPEPAVDPDAEIPPVPADRIMKFPGQPIQHIERTPEEAAAELLAMLAELRSEGRETVGPKDFAPYGKGTRIGRARSWISGKLTALADEGVYLEETDEVGVYKLLDPELTPA
ncbi:TraB protein [Streptomyces rimosus subsp. pseudoverticillatus]|nr:TraB protein [Streptomyces rimosus subsp. pseudoverticillatus]